jgi:hypothetical protein
MKNILVFAKLTWKLVKRLALKNNNLLYLALNKA